MDKTPQAVLLSCTPDPMSVMVRAWFHDTDTMEVKEEVLDRLDMLWERWTVEPTSILEFVHFSFLLKNVSRAFLAQITRHRHLGFWVTSMRTTDMAEFATEEDYDVPASLPEDVVPMYREAMWSAQSWYKELVGKGTSREDARGVIPLASHTSIAVTGNLRAWAGLFRQRACLMAQQGMWKPLLDQMRWRLVQIDARFSDLFKTPCEYGKGDCPYQHEQEKRIADKAPSWKEQPSMAVCPKYLTKKSG